MYIRQRHEHDYALTAPLCCEPISLTLAAVGTAVSAATSLMGMSMAQKGAKQQQQGALAAAAAEKQAAEYRATQLDMKAKEAGATAQRGALETVRKGMLAQSSLRARAAASGAGASDEGVLALGEQIAGQGEYERLMQMYSGQNAAAGYNDAAAAERYNGSSALIAGQNKATAIANTAKAQQLASIGSVAQSVGGFAEKAAGFGKLPSAASTYGASAAGLDLSKYALKGWGYE